MNERVTYNKSSKSSSEEELHLEQDNCTTKLTRTEPVDDSNKHCNHVLPLLDAAVPNPIEESAEKSGDDQLVAALSSSSGASVATNKHPPIHTTGTSRPLDPYGGLNINVQAHPAVDGGGRINQQDGLDNI